MRNPVLVTTLIIIMAVPFTANGAIVCSAPPAGSDIISDCGITTATPKEIDYSCDDYEKEIKKFTDKQKEALEELKVLNEEYLRSIEREKKLAVSVDVINARLHKLYEEYSINHSELEYSARKVLTEHEAYLNQTLMCEEYLNQQEESKVFLKVAKPFDRNTSEDLEITKVPEPDLAEESELTEVELDESEEKQETSLQVSNVLEISEEYTIPEINTAVEVNFLQTAKQKVIDNSVKTEVDVEVNLAVDDEEFTEDRDGEADEKPRTFITKIKFAFKNLFSKWF